MKAIVFERHGGPEVLELREVPDPRPAVNEVLVEVRACGINHLDLWVRQGLRGLDIEMPHILGNDVVGVARAWTGRSSSGGSNSTTSSTSATIRSSANTC